MADYSTSTNGRIVVLSAWNSSTPGQVLHTFVATGQPAFNVPIDVALDSAANVYVCDVQNSRIVVLSGLHSASPGQQLYSFGHAVQAVAVDSQGTIYVGDNQYDRVIILAGITSSTPGQVLYNFNSVGQVTGLRLDSTGRILLSNYEWQVYLLAPLSSANPGQVLGSFTFAPTQIGATGIAVDAAGTLYLSSLHDNQLHVLSGFDSAQPGTQLASTNGNRQGSAVNGTLLAPQGVALDAMNRVYVTDSLNRVVILAPFASGASSSTGSGAAGSGSGGAGAHSTAPSSSLSSSSSSLSPSHPAPGTQLFAWTAGGALSRPYIAAVDTQGRVYAPNNDPNSATQSIVVMAGPHCPQPGSLLYLLNDTVTGLSNPDGLVVDAQGRLFVADTSASRIVVLAALNDSRRGTELYSWPEANPHAYAWGIVLDAAGNVYVGDSYNERVLVLSGLNSASPGSQLYSWSDGFSVPYSVALDAAASVYVADSNNQRIVVLAGIGSASPGSQLYAITASLSEPRGVAVDAAGNIVVADSYNNRVVILAGIHTAQPGALLYSFTNSATPPALQYPTGVTIDADGNILVADTSNNRIVVLAGAAPTDAGVALSATSCAVQPTQQTGASSTASTTASAAASSSGSLVSAVGSTTSIPSSSSFASGTSSV